MKQRLMKHRQDLGKRAVIESVKSDQLKNICQAFPVIAASSTSWSMVAVDWSLTLSGEAASWDLEFKGLPALLQLSSALTQLTNKVPSAKLRLLAVLARKSHQYSAKH